MDVGTFEDSKGESWARESWVLVEKELLKGAEKAREVSVPYLAEIRHAVGIRALG